MLVATLSCAFAAAYVGIYVSTFQGFHIYQGDPGRTPSGPWLAQQSVVAATPFRRVANRVYYFLLSGALFLRALLSGALFTGALLSGALFLRALLSGALFTESESLRS